MDYNIQVITASQIKAEPNNRYADYLLSKHRVGGTGTMYYDYNMVISRVVLGTDPSDIRYRWRLYFCH